jgi:hypothetical protein
VPNATTIALIGAAISLVSLGVASATMYFAWLRRGRLRMTRPSVVAFAFEGRAPKIILRTMLYSTAQRGKMIESMHVKLCRDSSEDEFSFWGYGEAKELVPGGLYVGQTGVAAYHHFIRSRPEYPFVDGDYIIKIFARQPSDREPRLLSEVPVRINGAEMGALGNLNAVRYELQPDGQTYRGHVNKN